MGISHRSYVKLSSAVVAILVGGLKWQTQFWMGTTQGLFQQSLVEIGSVVSEKKIFEISADQSILLALAAILNIRLERKTVTL